MSGSDTLWQRFLGFVGIGSYCHSSTYQIYQCVGILSVSLGPANNIAIATTSSRSCGLFPRASDTFQVSSWLEPYEYVEVFFISLNVAIGCEATSAANPLTLRKGSNINCYSRIVHRRIACQRRIRLCRRLRTCGRL